ncbi:hypothetical protein HPB50_014375 [Hyalomma asiaticum]|uniref:Uncharacterized protein n=1 Tax=Hyalomma asiaticum TaxID=266040 RepID=A0ACB7RPE8_HYAAI|nr:hypothetical protein HPB50_014375 [Hyalomma asiaticum]
MQRRALVGDVVGGGGAAVMVGPAVRGVPGSGAVAGSTVAADLGAARGLTYAAVLSSGAQACPLGSGPTSPAGAAGQQLGSVLTAVSLRRVALECCLLRHPPRARSPVSPAMFPRFPCAAAESQFAERYRTTPYHDALARVIRLCL